MSTRANSGAVRATVAIQGTFAPGYEQHFDDYSSLMREFLARHGATVVRRQLVEKTIYGRARPDLFMVIDFPDRSVVELLFLQGEYLGIVPLRNKVFAEFEMHVAAHGEV
ncbi:DUF1330 domain-containing protein [Rhodococcus jostii]|uniref:Uncharacterized conserved protein, DUF1330 family n=1 Tax=Rhodococcus jostii TaxID=132919 RepID=A0A1H4TH65_RHOJO|nr:DUF1330 domain-containing protein [Rhodococcus jostii]SEC55669.1 Uncharacterized conserved protein, DUF1330 family [Rhodococcus jostii]